MTRDEQIELWLNGQSVHNPTRDECTPDFSCCRPELLAPEEIRIAYRDAHKQGDQKALDVMNAAFLYKLLGIHGYAVKSRIIGGEQ
jgi:hypothetical protein